MANAGRPGPAHDGERLFQARRNGLFAVDVLAGVDGLGEQRWPHLRGGGVEKHGVVLVGQGRIEVAREARDAVDLGQLGQLGLVAADEDRIGHDPVAIARATPPSLRMATMERTRCWFVPMRPVTPFITMPSRRSPMTPFPSAVCN